MIKTITLMKKEVYIYATSILTAVAIVGGTFGFLYGGGNIKIERNEQIHSKQVIIDGETTKDSK